jgi:hypothetical protein
MLDTNLRVSLSSRVSLPKLDGLLLVCVVSLPFMRCVSAFPKKEGEGARWEEDRERECLCFRMAPHEPA